MRAAVGSGGAIQQAFQGLLPEASHPFVGCAHAHPGGMRGLFHAPSMLEHSLRKKGSTTRRQTGLFMQVHPGLSEGWLGPTTSIPGPPRMNNLLRDHS